MASYHGSNKDGSVDANVPRLITTEHYDPIARLIAYNIQLWFI